jgi:ferritin-like protein
MARDAAAPVKNRNAGGQRWALADIPYERIDRDAADREEMFYLVAAASLMEAASDLYTQNLIDFFAGDAEVTDWLAEAWLPEELQHGRALRAYVEAAWPQFDWPGAYRRFHEEFTLICEQDGVEERHSLEMASRCVVEMGTASYYTTLSRASREPVLALLAGHILEDEVRHYKHFYRFFRKYRGSERARRAEVLPALWRRLRMTGGSDSFAALKHVHLTRHPEARFDDATYRRLRARCRAAVGRHFPHRMSVKMLLKPLDLGPRAQRIVVPAVTLLARRLVP